MTKDSNLGELRKLAECLGSVEVLHLQVVFLMVLANQSFEEYVLEKSRVELELVDWTVVDSLLQNRVETDQATEVWDTP